MKNFLYTALHPRLALSIVAAASVLLSLFVVTHVTNAYHLSWIDGCNYNYGYNDCSDETAASAATCAAQGGSFFAISFTGICEGIACPSEAIQFNCSIPDAAPTCATNPAMDGCSCSKANACNSTSGTYSGGVCTAPDPAPCPSPPSSCTPSSACSASTCSGTMCSDSCGNSYWGTMSCTLPPSCTPSSACSASTCSGSTCSDSCGNTYAGTMSCTLPPSCTPSSACSASTCSGSTCSDSCGNTYAGTMSCATMYPNLTQPSISYVPSSNFDLITGNYNQLPVTFTTSNNGNAAAGASNYQFQFDSGSNGYEITRSSSLGAAAISQMVTRNESLQNVPFGPTSIRIMVDYGNSVSESSESDNERTISFVLPPPDPGLSINVDRTQVRAGESALLTWSSVASYPMNCRVFGPGVNIVPSALNGSQQTQGINAKSEFTYSCTEPITGVTFTDSVFVETTGRIEEI